MLFLLVTRTRFEQGYALFICFANILLYVRAPPPTANRRTWTIEFDSPVNFNIQKNRSLSKITGFRGGDGESRTLDLSDANRTLYQLSYAPIFYFQ